MSKCERCNLIIYDDTIKCPLCKGVIATLSPADEVEHVSRSVMYPDVAEKMKVLQLVMKIMVFATILVTAICMLINYMTYNGMWWSLIVGATLIYACFTVGYSARRVTGHRTKILILSFLALLISILVDHVIGYMGWSVNIFIPSAIILLEITIIILMLVTVNWQNYIFMLIATGVFSVLYLVLIPLDIVTFELLSVIAATFSCVFLLGVVIFGDKVAKNEIERRFHV